MRRKWSGATVAGWKFNSESEDWHFQWNAGLGNAGSDCPSAALQVRRRPVAKSRWMMRFILSLVYVWRQKSERLWIASHRGFLALIRIMCVCVGGGARGQCEERAAALAGRRALLPWPPRTVLPLGGRLFRRYAGVDAFGFIVFNGHDIIVVEHLFRPCFCIIDTACGVYDSFL